MFPTTTKTTTNDRDATFTSPFFAFHQKSMHFPQSFFQTGPLFSDEYDLNENENFDDENNFFSTQTLLRRKRVTAKQFHFPSQTFLRYFWYARFGLIVCAEPCGGRNDDVDGFLRKVRSMGTTIPTDDHGGFRRRGQQQQQQQRQREENSYYWYRRGGGGGGRGRIPKPREGREGGGRGGAKFYRHFSPSSFRGDANRGLGGGVGGAGFRHHRDEGASSGEDGGAWSIVPLISASTHSSSSTCSSSQISSYGGMNVPYYGSPYDFEAAFGLSPSFRRIGGGQSSTKRRLRRLEERIALGINLDENGIPFDRELTEEQRERLFEFRAFKKELERGDPFVENAEALGLFLEYEEEKNVLLLGCGTSSSSSSSSSLSGSPSSTTTAVHSSSSKSGSDNTNDENTDSTDDDDDENKEDNDEDERENRHHQNDKNDSNDIENEHSCFDLETFVKDVAERLHVDDDSIDSETEYKDGNSKGTSSGVSSLDVSHEQQ